MFAPVKCPSIKIARTTNDNEPTAASLWPYTPISEKNIPNIIISANTRILMFITRLAIKATNTKHMMANVNAFLRRIKGPGWSVSATKLVPRGKRKYSFKIPKWARTTHGSTVASVILMAEYTYWLVTNFLSSAE
jgi:hypothetical protein